MLVQLLVLVLLIQSTECCFKKTIVLRGPVILRDKDVCPNSPGCGQPTPEPNSTTVSPTVSSMTSSLADSSSTTTYNATTVAANRIGEVFAEDDIDFSEEFDKLPEGEEVSEDEAREFYDDVNHENEEENKAEDEFDKTMTSLKRLEHLSEQQRLKRSAVNLHDDGEELHLDIDDDEYDEDHDNDPIDINKLLQPHDNANGGEEIMLEPEDLEQILDIGLIT